jgi:hypothetical protein
MMSELMPFQSLETLKQVETLEQGFLQQEQQDCPVVHRFGPGIYIREVTIPGGTLSIGHYQKTTHLNIMLKGRVIMVNENGEKTELVAPQTFVSGPGRKIGLIVETMVWQNVYATTETDVEKLEELLLEKSQVWKDYKKEQDLLLSFDYSKDEADYFETIKNWGFDDKTVRAQSEEKSDQIPFPSGGYKVMVADSKIEGKGLFATGNFDQGEIIAPARIFGMRTPAGRYTNHAKNANAIMVLRDNMDIDLVANSPIKGCQGGNLGEEITVNYGQVLGLMKGN